MTSLKKGKAINKNIALVIMCAFFIFLGVFCITGGMNDNEESSRLKKVCTEEAQAVVIDFHVTGNVYWDDDKEIDKRVYYPLFEYSVNNETYRKQSSTGENVKRVAVGGSMAILYDPANPDDYYVPAGAYASKGGTSVIGFGIFLIVFAGVALVVKLIQTLRRSGRA